jgi:hypothetical protein
MSDRGIGDRLGLTRSDDQARRSYPGGFEALGPIRLDKDKQKITHSSLSH